MSGSAELAAIDFDPFPYCREPPLPRAGLMIRDVVRRLTQRHFPQLAVARLTRHPEVPNALAA
jgi:hypothetical protein